MWKQYRLPWCCFCHNLITPLILHNAERDPQIFIVIIHTIIDIMCISFFYKIVGTFITVNVHNFIIGAYYIASYISVYIFILDQSINVCCVFC